MVTIREVAKEANVSISTVSRVINNSPNVTRDKRNRVLAAIEEVGYVANPKVKEPVQNSTQVILVITTIFHGPLCSAIDENASEAGFNVLFKYTGEYDEEISNKMATVLNDVFLKEDMPAGIILLNPSMSKNKYLETIISKYPIVQVGCSLKNYGEYTVSTDDFQAAYDMTSYLLERGYRRIALVTPNDTIDASRYSYMKERYFGYNRALKNAGIREDNEIIIYCDSSEKGGRIAAREILQMKERPDAVFCLSDRMAAGCLKTLISAGVKVPEEIGVAGFDNDSYASELIPALTTVSQAFDDIGAEAVQMLSQMIRGDISNGRRLYVAHSIAVRESTK